MPNLSKYLIVSKSLTAGKYIIKPRFYIILAIVILLIAIICIANWDKVAEILYKPKFTSRYWQMVFYERMK